jgi:hypothetical protein
MSGAGHASHLIWSAIPTLGQTPARGGDSTPYSRRARFARQPCTELTGTLSGTSRERAALSPQVLARTACRQATVRTVPLAAARTIPAARLTAPGTGSMRACPSAIFAASRQGEFATVDPALEQ